MHSGVCLLFKRVVFFGAMFANCLVSVVVGVSVVMLDLGNFAAVNVANDISHAIWRC